MLQTSPASHPAAAPRGRNVIAVASGKGGVGKTWLAITLSHALARAGKKTLLFDGDLGLANVDIQLGLMPERDLGAVVAGRSRLEDTVTSYREGGFDIIAGKSGSGSLASLERARLTELRDDLLSLARRYDRVVLDLGAGVAAGVRMLAGTGRTTLVVTTDEPTALTDAYAFIKLMATQGRGEDVRVLVNQAESLADGKRTYGRLRRACEGFLKFAPPLAGVVRRDDKVKDAIRRQMALLQRHPTSAAATDVERVAKKLGGGP